MREERKDPAAGTHTSSTVHDLTISCFVDAGGGKHFLRDTSDIYKDTMYTNDVYEHTLCVKSRNNRKYTGQYLQRDSQRMRTFSGMSFRSVL